MLCPPRIARLSTTTVLLTVCSTLPMLSLVHAQAPSAATVESQAVAGKWAIRIDGGGEIYRAVLALKLDEENINGTYQTEGRRSRIEQLKLKGQTLSFQVQTQRFGRPVTAVFTADVNGKEMKGEVDFDSGSSSRSYDFVAEQVSGTVSKNGLPERETPQSQPAIENNDATASPTAEVSVFRNGVDGYEGTVDAEIWAIAPTKSLLKQGTMTTDGNNGGGESQVLLKFGDILGNEPGQIPPKSRIINAQLTVVAFDPGTTCYLHRLLVPWKKSVTWDRMGNGISVDNREASTVRDGFTFAEINMDKQDVAFDVTSTVQLWSDGVENFGWVFVNTGGNGWDFYSSDEPRAEFHPMLKVEFSRGPIAVQ